MQMYLYEIGQKKELKNNVDEIKRIEETKVEEAEVDRDVLEENIVSRTGTCVLKVNNREVKILPSPENHSSLSAELPVVDNVEETEDEDEGADVFISS